MDSLSFGSDTTKTTTTTTSTTRRISINFLHQKPPTLQHHTRQGAPTVPMVQESTMQEIPMSSKSALKEHSPFKLQSILEPTPPCKEPAFLLDKWNPKDDQLASYPKPLLPNYPKNQYLRNIH
ncbi:hypothetical protein Ccrd_024635, partial [Cynara cardunculus var. scolymus]